MADHGSNVHENRDSIVHGQSSLGCLQLRFRTTKQSIEIKLLNRKKSHLYIPPPFCIAIDNILCWMSIICPLHIGIYSIKCVYIIYIGFFPLSPLTWWCVIAVDCFPFMLIGWSWMASLFHGICNSIENDFECVSIFY